MTRRARLHVVHWKVHRMPSQMSSLKDESPALMILSNCRFERAGVYMLLIRGIWKE